MSSIIIATSLIYTKNLILLSHFNLFLDKIINIM
jgi:hypothetical protein